MSYWFLTMQGTVISRTTVQRVTNLEKETDEVKAAVSEFDSKISQLLRKSRTSPMMEQSQTQKTGQSTFSMTQTFSRSSTTL
jgi:phage shock protein A